MIIKIVPDQSGETALIEASGRVFHKTIAINDSSLDVIRSHSTDVLKQIGIVWESVGHLDLFGDQRRDPDWRHEGEDGEDDVDGWTYNVVWWVNRAGLFDVAIVDGSVYIMSDSGQTVESLR
jgi:hypothetical protein